MYDKFLKKYKKAPITFSVIGICIVVYVISFVLFGEEMTVYDGMTFGAYNPVFVRYNHEYYRLITANFVHFGLLHLVINCYSLYGIGIFMEKVLQQKKYFIVLFTSALTTTGFSYILYILFGFGANTVSAGISGVIFGLIGSLGALALKYKNIFMDIFKQLAPNVLLMLIISFIVPSISMSGHVFGLAGGFLSTSLLLKKTFQNQSQDLLN